MIWLRTLVILIDIYLLLSLGAWFALRYLQWRVQRSGRSLDSGAERLVALSEGIRAHSGRWPLEPRPGRYAVPDQLARDHLAIARSAVAEAEALRPLLASPPYLRVSLAQALALGALLPLLRALRAWRDARALWRLIDRAANSLDTVEKQGQAVDGIPSRARATLNEIRAEVSRLSAVLESVEEQGMMGLERTSWQLAEIGMKAEHALDRLASASNAPQAIYEIDKELGEAGADLQELDKFLGEAAEARGRAQSLLARVFSALDLVEERWKALRARGAVEPPLATAIEELRARSGRLPDLERSPSLDRFQKVTRAALALDTDIQALAQRLDGLDEAMRDAKDAVTEAQASLAETMEMCQALGRADGTLQPDLSLTLVGQAHQTAVLAEEARTEGTSDGYARATAIADQALQTLTQARQGLAEMPDAVRQAQKRLEALSDAERQAWQNRLAALTRDLQAYPRHWARGLEREANEAAAALASVDRALADTPEEVRARRRFSQSALLVAQEALARGLEQAEVAEQRLASLETNLHRIAELRERLEKAIADIAERTLPALQALRPQMLAELQQRLDRFTGTFGDESRLYLDPAQVDYDEALDRWLPAVRQEIEELAGEQRASVRHYHKMAHEAIHRIDRLWARLQRLDPYAMPVPEEDVQSLGRELDAWRAAVEYEAENPASLRDLIARDAKNLERRLEETVREIEESRARLVALSKDYQRLAANNERIDALVRQAETESHWARLSWGAEEARAAWEEAIALERESAGARTLAQAVDRLQRGANAARRAESLYQGLERQIASALGRLDGELQTIGRLAERAARLEESLRQEQRPDEAREVSAQLDAANRALDLAAQATMFDDALRHLRTARQAIEQAL